MENKASKIMEAIKPGDLVLAAVKLPSVRVNREKFIRAQFDKVFDEEMVLRIIEVGPHEAGIPKKDITALARSVIRYETTIVSLISSAAGVPGGWAMAATIPADMAQYQGAMLRVAQKLAYLHDWAELVPENNETIDDATKNVLLMFLGSMYGVKVANKGIGFVAKSYSVKLAKTIQASPLTKGAVYPIVKQVSQALGIQMNKQILGQVASKTVPVVGAVLSGGLTFYSFRGMANKLHQHLSQQQSLKTIKEG
jgi:hypothetical protein